MSPASLLVLVETEMAAYIAERLQSVRLFSSDPVRLESVQRLSLSISLESVQPLCFN